MLKQYFKNGARILVNEDEMKWPDHEALQEKWRQDRYVLDFGGNSEQQNTTILTTQESGPHQTDNVRDTVCILCQYLCIHADIRMNWARIALIMCVCVSCVEIFVYACIYTYESGLHSTDNVRLCILC